MSDIVRSAWVHAVTRRGGQIEKAVSSADDLLEQYAEPHRRYHTEQHIRAVLADSALLAEELDLEIAEREVLDLAVCAHDVIYNGQAGEDERASAAWARTHLIDAALSEDDAARVEMLILATTNHEATGADLLAEVLLDADLAILGADEERYDGYVRAVRAEYAHVPDELWRVGRGDVLRGFVDRDVIYRTSGARRRWEAAARNNLLREMSTLGGAR
ncbi:HD domain-containing protein [Allokutzneria oryzae]|uniref:Metal-dependent phosphohydrolase n=1 Tax=Allokutzneria oryzae TaxID=1378989 RepID=A0ABV5ZW23_9PSEU